MFSAVMHTEIFVNYEKTWYSVCNAYYKAMTSTENFSPAIGYRFHMTTGFVEWLCIWFSLPLHNPVFYHCQHCFLDSADIALQFPSEFPSLVDFNNKSS